MGIVKISPVLLGLFLFSPAVEIPACAQPVPARIQPDPLQDRMVTWKMKRKHPDPRYLSIAEPFPEVDEKPRIYDYIWLNSKPGQVRSVLIWKGRDSWRPDASAQVDEIKADLLDEAKAGGYK